MVKSYQKKKRTFLILLPFLLLCMFIIVTGSSSQKYSAYSTPVEISLNNNAGSEEILGSDLTIKLKVRNSDDVKAKYIKSGIDGTGYKDQKLALYQDNLNYYSAIREAFAQKHGLTFQKDIASPFIFISVDKRITSENDFAQHYNSLLSDENIEYIQINDRLSPEFLDKEEESVLRNGTMSSDSSSINFEQLASSIELPQLDTNPRANIAILHNGIVDKNFSNEYVNLRTNITVNNYSVSSERNIAHSWDNATGMAALIRYFAPDSHISSYEFDIRNPWPDGIEDDGFIKVGGEYVYYETTLFPYLVQNHDIIVFGSNRTVESLGGYGYHYLRLVTFLEWFLYDNNVILISAAGDKTNVANEENLLLGAPGIMDGVLTVGASNNDLTGRSETSRYLDPDTDAEAHNMKKYFKPDIYAPGGNILFGGNLGSLSGSDLAAAQVAAAALHIIDFDPSYRANPTKLYALLMASATAYNLSNQEMYAHSDIYRSVGAGILNVRNAFYNITNSLDISNFYNYDDPGNFHNYPVSLKQGETIKIAAFWYGMKKENADQRWPLYANNNNNIYLYDRNFNELRKTTDFESNSTLPGKIYNTDILTYTAGYTGTYYIKIQPSNPRPFLGLPAEQARHMKIEAGGVAWAIDDEVGFYRRENADGGLTLTGARNIPSDLVIPSDIMGKSVTAIDSYAFTGAQIESLHIPATVKSIGSHAFNNCVQLASVTFDSCSSLETIGDNAFSDSISLSNITIPSSVVNIGDRAFAECLLTNFAFQYGSRLENLGSYAFNDTGLRSIRIPANVTELKSNTFAECSLLTSVTFESESKLEIIGDNVLAECIALRTLYFSDNLKIIDDYAFFHCIALTEVSLPESLISIGDYAFSGCTGLRDLYLGGTKTIGNYAFQGCKGVSEVYLSSVLASVGVNAFIGWTSAQTIYVMGRSSAPSGWGGFWNAEVVWNTFVFKRGNLAFKLSNNEFEVSVIADISQNSIETDIVIPASCIGLPVTKISDNGFKNCGRIPSVTIAASIKIIGKDAFYGCYSLREVTFESGSRLMSIEDGTFSFCENLTKITIPANVNSIGLKAFSGSYQLAEIYVDPDNNNYSSMGGVLFSRDQSELVMCPVGKTGAYSIPDGVTHIGSKAFSGCSSLSVISIPDSVTHIGSNAFYGSNLTHIVIPGSVIFIGDNAFESCNRLINIDVEAGNTKYSSVNGALFNKGQTILIICPAGKTGAFIVPASVTDICARAFYDCIGLTDIVLPVSVRTIGESAFFNCRSLHGISIPSRVSTIENWTFAFCVNLTSVSLPSSLKEIGDFAFNSCHNLRGITFPYSVDAIGEFAFEDCYSLTSISLPGGLKRLGSYAFSGTGVINNVNGVKYVDDWAVGYDGNLSQLSVLPETKGIAESAFKNCFSLEALIIPESIKYIGNYAFTGCTMSSLSIVRTANYYGPIIELAEKAFYNGYSTKIILPDISSLNEYSRAANWKHRFLTCSDFENLVGGFGENEGISTYLESGNGFFEYLIHTKSSEYLHTVSCSEPYRLTLYDRYGILAQGFGNISTRLQGDIAWLKVEGMPGSFDLSSVVEYSTYDLDYILISDAVYESFENDEYACHGERIRDTQLHSLFVNYRFKSYLFNAMNMSPEQISEILSTQISGSAIGVLFYVKDTQFLDSVSLLQEMLAGYFSSEPKFLVFSYSMSINYYQPQETQMIGGDEYQKGIRVAESFMQEYPNMQDDLSMGGQQAFFFTHSSLAYQGIYDTMASYGIAHYTVIDISYVLSNDLYERQILFHNLIDDLRTQFSGNYLHYIFLECGDWLLPDLCTYLNTDEEIYIFSSDPYNITIDYSSIYNYEGLQRSHFFLIYQNIPMYSFIGEILYGMQNGDSFIYDFWQELDLSIYNPWQDDWTALSIRGFFGYYDVIALDFATAYGWS